jgi:hypothetical protein
MKSIKTFTTLKWSDMPGFIYKSRFVIAVAAAIILLASSCKKKVEAVQQDFLQQYFEQNILNKDFIVHLATESGVNKTSQFAEYKFKLTKNTLIDGPMTATSTTTTINGTWSSNEDYSKLVITLPANTVPAFSFLNREWRFTKKAVPLMELAPWGTTEPIVLHMMRL